MVLLSKVQTCLLINTLVQLLWQQVSHVGGAQACLQIHPVVTMPHTLQNHRGYRVLLQLHHFFSQCDLFIGTKQVSVHWGKKQSKLRLHNEDPAQCNTGLNQWWALLPNMGRKGSVNHRFTPSQKGFSHTLLYIRVTGIQVLTYVCQTSAFHFLVFS